MQLPTTLSVPAFFPARSSPYQYQNNQYQHPSFFSMPNRLPTPLQNTSPCPDVDYFDSRFHTYQQTPEVISTPMEMDDDYNQNQIFDMNDLDDVDDDFYDDDDDDDSMSGQSDHLASQLLETMQNLRKQSEETNKMLKNIVNMNSPSLGK
ncbi:Uncharacterized protein QTN25_007569 [Entamoeba marina]